MFDEEYSLDVSADLALLVMRLPGHEARQAEREYQRPRVRLKQKAKVSNEANRPFDGT